MDILRSVSWNGTTISEIAYAPGERMPTHIHPELCITLILRGGIDERIGFQDQTGGAFQVALKAPGTEHRVAFPQCGARTLKIKISAGVLEAWDVDPAVTPRPRWLRRTAAVRSLFSALDSLRDTHLDADWVHDAAAEVLDALLRPHPQRRNSTPPAWLAWAHEELRASFVYGVRATHLAREVGVNRVTLSREFRRYYGLTLSQFVRELRVQAALEKLGTGNDSLSAIAASVGCADQSHLTRLLRHALGRTPQQLRPFRHS